jgi:hypothetical protein
MCYSGICKNENYWGECKYGGNPPGQCPMSEEEENEDEKE